MPASASSFREAFPEFSDAGVYSDARVVFWLGFAEKFTASKRWDACGFRDEGVQLLAAHYLSVEHAANSGAGGAASGALTGESQSAGGVSYSNSYDGSAYAGAGQLASTRYGLQYLDLCRMVGMGGVQL